MTRILLINGAPRRGGYTTDLLDHFEKGVQDAGGTLSRADLRSADVRPCKGCYSCWDPNRDGSCAVDDDMRGLIERVLNCDVLVLATPVYYYSFSALMKAFVERLLPTTGPIMDLSAPNGLERNTWRHPGRGPKSTALIAVGAHRSPGIMDGLVKSFEHVCHALYSRPAGTLLRRESFFLDFDSGKPITGRKVRLAFERAGGELVKTGDLSEETMRDAALQFTQSMDLFTGHSRTYWTIAKEIGYSSGQRKRLRDAVAKDLRILMPELALCFDPEAGRDVAATIQFTLEEGAQNWHLSIADGECKLSPGDATEPTLNLVTDTETLAEIILQRLDARSALAKGRMTAEGSNNLLARFGRLFPAPAS